MFSAAERHLFSNDTMRCRPNHFTTFQPLILLELTIKKLFVQLQSARIQAKATQ